LPMGATVSFIADTTGGDIENNGADWRVVDAVANQEIPRWVNDEANVINSATTQTFFKVQRDIVANAVATNYWAYYKNSAAILPEFDLNLVFIFGEDFEFDGNKFTNNGRGETILGVTDPLTGRAAQVQTNNITGGLHYDLMQPLEVANTYVFSHRIRRRGRDGSFGHFLASSEVFANRSHAWGEASMIGFSEIETTTSSNNPLVFTTNAAYVSWFNDVDTDWQSIRIHHNLATGEIDAFRNGTEFTTSDLRDRLIPGAARPTIKSIALEGQNTITTDVEVDNYFIYLYLATPPVISVGVEECMAPQPRPSNGNSLRYAPSTASL
jgi:hypothetical protein